MTNSADDAYSNPAVETFVKKEVQKLFADYAASEGDAFAQVAVREYFDIQDEDALLERCHIGGKNDRGIDAFWHDPADTQLVVVQAKYAEGGLGSFDRRPITELDSAYSWLTTLDTQGKTKAREEVIAAARTLQDLRREEPHYPVFLYCIGFGEFTEVAREQADLFNEEHKADAVEMILIDFEKLAERVEARWSRDEPLTEDVTLTLQQYFRFEPDGQPKAIVGTIDGTELAKIEREQQFRIFQRNVRYFLKATGNVNKSIERTLNSSEGRDQFWYYNNGIVIVCDQFELNELDEHSAVIAMKNMQIVNGCQTTTTLGNNVQLLEGEANHPKLLVRIVQSADEDLQSRITLYTNRQNEVKDRDLSSNDVVQDRLQGEFATLSPPWFYERKRGEWDARLKETPAMKKKFANGIRRVDNEKAAQASYAFYEAPDKARADKRLLFARADEGGFYETVFNESTSAEKLLLPFRIAKLIDGKKREYLREYKRAAGGRDVAADKIQAREWIKFADQFILGTIAFYIKQRYPLDQGTYELLLGERFDDMVAGAYSVSVADLHVHFGQVRRDAERRQESFSTANYVKNNWKEVKDHLENLWDRTEDVGRDPLAGIPLLESESA